MKIGMYSSDEIYEELANGFLHRSMVDAMYFEIKKLREENEQLKKQKDEIKKYIKSFEYYIPKEHKTELLRMLGEIDNEYEKNCK